MLSRGQAKSEIAHNYTLELIQFIITPKICTVRKCFNSQMRAYGGRLLQIFLWSLDVVLQILVYINTL